MSLRLVQEIPDVNIMYLEEYKTLQIEPRVLCTALDRCAYFASRNTDKYYIDIKSGRIWYK